MVNFRKNQGRKYIRNLILIILIFLFLVTSKIVFQEKDEIQETKLNDSISLLDKSFTLVNRVYYTKEQTILFELYTTEDSEPLPDNINVEAKKERGDIKVYPTKIYKISENYLVCFIQDVPEKWVSMRVEITDQTKKNILTLTNDTLFLSHTTLEEQEHLVIQDSSFYEKKSLDYLLNDTKNALQKSENATKEKEAEVEKIQAANTNLKGQLDVKTEKEKKETLEQITSNDSQIQALKMDIEKEKLDKEALKEKVKKIESKKQKLDVKGGKTGR